MFDVSQLLLEVNERPSEMRAELGRALLLLAPVPKENSSEWSFRTRTLGRVHMTTPEGHRLMLSKDDRVYPLLPKVGKSFANTILIGRASTNDVQLEHSSVSKLHARIEIGADEFRLFDAEASNPTVAGMAEIEPTGLVLSEGTVISWGACSGYFMSSDTFLSLLTKLSRT